MLYFFIGEYKMEQESVVVEYWLNEDSGLLVADITIGGKRKFRFEASKEEELASKVRSFVKRNNLQEIHNGLPV